MGIKKRSKLSSYMWYTRTSLRLVGLWPSGNAGIYNFLYFIVVAVSFIVQAFQMLANCWINYTNFESAAESIGPMMALVTSFGKMCTYRRQRSRLGHLVVSLENCLKHGPAEVLENLENYATIATPACGSLLAVSWLLTVVFLSAPLLLANNNARVLPFASWYPFDYGNSTFLYAIAYGHEAILTSLGCCTMSTEITFLWSIFHCCSRFRVLSHRLSILSLCGNNNDDNSSDHDEKLFSTKINLELSSLMKLHYEVLRNETRVYNIALEDVLFRDLTEINLAYTYLVVILFFAALIAICCAGLQITGSSAESFDWTAGLFVILAMYYAEQLLFYYLPGEIVAQEAMAVSFAAYASGWESLSLKHQRTILLMIMRSQLPPRLLVGQLSPLRLENYSAFLTTTASYFTSLRAVA